MQCWDTDDGALEPAEPDSDEEDEAITEDQSKKKRWGAPPVPDDGSPKHLWQCVFRQGCPGFNACALWQLGTRLIGGRGPFSLVKPFW